MNLLTKYLISSTYFVFITNFFGFKVDWLLKIVVSVYKQHNIQNILAIKILIQKFD